MERSNLTLTRALWLVAVVLALASALTYISIGTWPFGSHVDEVKKARYIISGEQDFLHPILLLQLPRLANLFLGYTEPPDALALGRVFSGIAGGLLVFATFLLGRAVLAPTTALAVAVAVAVCPLIAIHATFLKEDIYVAAASVFALAALLALVDHPTARRALIAGLSFGAAAAAKYVGAILLPYALIVVLIGCPVDLKTRLRLGAVMVATAFVVFAAINAPALFDPAAFSTGFGTELRHALTGHFDVRLPIWLTNGVFHVRQSLLPGLGLPLLILGLAGLAAPFVNPRRRRPLAIILGAALLWYLVHEISPLKAFPNFERYMVPVAPLLVVLGASLVETIVSWRSARFAAVAAPALVVLAGLPALYASITIVAAAQHDPRRIVPQIVSSLGPQVRFDRYVAYDRTTLENALTAIGGPSPPIRVMVTSSFVYRVLAFHGDDPSQPEETRSAFKFYGDLFRHPYLELSSNPSFGFLNPEVRIVALDDDIDHLVSIGQAVLSVDPYVGMTIGP